MAESRQLQDPIIRPDAQRAEPDVEVGEADGEEAGPCPEHVPPVEAAHARVGGETERRARELVDAAARDMSHRMAAEQVAAEQEDVRREQQRAEADAERRGS